MDAFVVSALLLALGAAFYAQGLLGARRGTFVAELRVALEILRDGAWSPAETLLIASRRTLDEREASRWLEHRGSTFLRMACETASTDGFDPGRARIRCELETRTSGGETRASMQLFWPARSDGAESRVSQLLLERIAAELS